MKNLGNIAFVLVAAAIWVWLAYHNPGDIASSILVVAGSAHLGIAGSRLFRSSVTREMTPELLRWLDQRISQATQERDANRSGTPQAHYCWGRMDAFSDVANLIKLRGCNEN